MIDLDYEIDVQNIVFKMILNLIKKKISIDFSHDKNLKLTSGWSNIMQPLQECHISKISRSFNGCIIVMTQTSIFMFDAKSNKFSTDIGKYGHCEVLNLRYTKKCKDVIRRILRKYNNPATRYT
jgi:hypothetical protein